MRRVLLTLVVCCFSFGTPAAAAGPFGTLYSWEETPNFVPHGLTSSPDAAKWLMTLPETVSWPDVDETDAGMQAALLDPNPIGGTAYELLPDAQRTTSEFMGNSSVARQLFDGEPMGSEPHRLSNEFAVATGGKVGAGQFEGRSASSGAHGSTPGRLEPETCTCMNSQL